MITSKTANLYHSYFRFFLQQSQNLKYEVFYEEDKKNLKLVVSLILKSFIHHIDATRKVRTIITSKTTDLYNSYFRF